MQICKIIQSLAKSDNLLLAKSVLLVRACLKNTQLDVCENTQLELVPLKMFRNTSQWIRPLRAQTKAFSSPRNLQTKVNGIQGYPTPRVPTPLSLRTAFVKNLVDKSWRADYATWLSEVALNQCLPEPSRDKIVPSQWCYFSLERLSSNGEDICSGFWSPLLETVIACDVSPVAMFLFWNME